MRVLVACEFSGVVREAFRAKGHDAWSCDLLPSLDNSSFHYHTDVLSILYDFKWDLMIAHPPCTYLCNSGVRWFKDNPDRWHDFDDAVVFFNILQDAPIPRICIENPIPHKYTRAGVGKYDQIVQPWQFGHGETKATCLWLKNLPPLEPTDIVEGRDNRIHLMFPSKDRGKKRSITYQGIASAMAEQWG